MREGRAARDLALAVVRLVIAQGRTLEAALQETAGLGDGLHARDRAFARAIVMATLRHWTSLGHLVGQHLERGLPPGSGPLEAILKTTAAQIVLLDAPAYAAIDIAVTQAKHHPKSRRFAALANAVLRKTAQSGPAAFAALDRAFMDIPGWLHESWVQDFGQERARSIAAASLSPAELDLTVKHSDQTAAIAAELGGRVLATGSIRIAGGIVPELAGFADGAWWVQDAAAALPARLLPLAPGAAVLDLCAAPGGKTAQLAARGAKVTAVDRSQARLQRVSETLDRLGLSAELIAADATGFDDGRRFDAILLDAPCSATGTIRRHPDILHHRKPSDVAVLVDVQARLLQQAVRLLGSGGILIYATCSLQRSEGEAQIEALLGQDQALARLPIAAGESGIPANWLTDVGELRTVPDLAVPLADGTARDSTASVGIDGFFVARLMKQ